MLGRYPSRWRPSKSRTGSVGIGLADRKSAQGGRLVDRQSNDEPGVARPRDDPKITAVSLRDDPVADVQTQARPLADRFGREERLEDLGVQILRNSDSGVSDLHHHMIVVAPGPDGQRAALG